MSHRRYLEEITCFYKEVESFMENTYNNPVKSSLHEILTLIYLALHLKSVRNKLLGFSIITLLLI